MSDVREAAPQGRALFHQLVATRPPREGRSAAAAAAASIGCHGVLVAGLVWATMAVAQPEQSTRNEKVVLYTPVPDAPPPPPPVAPKLDVPHPPAVAQVVARVEADIPKPKELEPAEPKGFKVLAPPTVTPPDIPPPSMVAPVREADYSGEGVAGGSSKGVSVALAAEKKVTAEDVSAAPTFTPYTVAPRLKNREDVARALQRYYPDMLRDAGVGGRVLVWFLIDENGHVRKFQVKETSGHDALDQAALKVADVMEFTPALNRDQKVAVWVALPVVFSASAAGGE